MELLSVSPIDPQVLEKLRKIVGDDNVSVTDVDRFTYGRDQSPISLLNSTEGVMRNPPAAIVWPETAEHVSEICRLAYKTDTPFLPFGAGSGVCGGTLTTKGGIVIDLKKMNKILSVDEKSNLVTVEAGIIGEHLERELAPHGCTIGHFPSSVYTSTLGGYLATRSAGQFSSKYGKIEDMVVGLEVVFPQGEIVTTLVTPRSATGPDWNQVMVGSEGTLGIITKATCRTWPLPQSRRFLAFIFRDVPTGVEAMRVMFRSDLRPAGVRLYDEMDTTLIGTSGRSGLGKSPLDFLPVQEFGKVMYSLVPGAVKKAKRFFAKKADKFNRVNRLVKPECLMLLVFEGEEKMVDYEYEVATTICENIGGINRGPELAMNWYKNRYHVSYKQSKVYFNGAFLDTIEVATTWDKVARMYEQVKAAVSPHAFVMAHFSHGYQEGCSVYFTFVTAANSPLEAERTHRAIWDTAMDATLRVGGTISHHHGIGKTKARFMEREHHQLMDVFQALKDELDPKGLCNPGKMGLKS